jgi:hypothetical protein
MEETRGRRKSEGGREKRATASPFCSNIFSMTCVVFYLDKFFYKGDKIKVAPGRVREWRRLYS